MPKILHYWNSFSNSSLNSFYNSYILFGSKYQKLSNYLPLEKDKKYINLVNIRNHESIYHSEWKINKWLTDLSIKKIIAITLTIALLFWRNISIAIALLFFWSITMLCSRHQHSEVCKCIVSEFGFTLQQISPKAVWWTLW